MVAAAANVVESGAQVSWLSRNQRRYANFIQCPTLSNSKSLLQKGQWFEAGPKKCRFREGTDILAFCPTTRTAGTGDFRDSQ